MDSVSHGLKPCEMESESMITYSSMLEAIAWSYKISDKFWSNWDIKTYPLVLLMESIPGMFMWPILPA